MNEEEKEDLKDIINDINKDVKTADQGKAEFSGYSRRYEEYKNEQEEGLKLNWYEKFCYKSASILSMEADESVKEDLNPPIRLLDWDITPGMVMSATVMGGLGAFFIWMILFTLNTILGLFPMSIMLMSIVFVVGAAAFIYYKPIVDAKNKVIRSSGEMILSVLYMVIYMKSSANLEGA
ncbi:MAG: hypothetical protein V5A72_00395, partial [Candidatus Nanohaloarchaea archaeon]